MRVLELLKEFEKIPKDEKKVIFDILEEYDSFSDDEKKILHLMLNLEDKRDEVAEKLKQIKTEDGSPYFNKEWINKNIFLDND